MKTLHQLRTTGFRRLREGRIHLRCYSCGRKLSNAPRQAHDPPNAFLMELLCEKHDGGCGGGEVAYFDAAGDEIRQADPDSLLIEYAPGVPGYLPVPPLDGVGEPFFGRLKEVADSIMGI